MKSTTKLPSHEEEAALNDFLTTQSKNVFPTEIWIDIAYRDPLVAVKLTNVSRGFYSQMKDQRDWKYLVEIYFTENPLLAFGETYKSYFKRIYTSLISTKGKENEESYSLDEFHRGKLDPNTN